MADPESYPRNHDNENDRKKVSQQNHIYVSVQCELYHQFVEFVSEISDSCLIPFVDDNSVEFLKKNSKTSVWEKSF